VIGKGFVFLFTVVYVIDVYNKRVLFYYYQNLFKSTKNLNSLFCFFLILVKLFYKPHTLRLVAKYLIVSTYSLIVICNWLSLHYYHHFFDASACQSLWCCLAPRFVKKTFGDDCLAEKD